MKKLHTVTFILLGVGGLNWLLVGFGYNLVDGLLGGGSMWSKIVYILVGLSAVYEVLTHRNYCKECAPASKMEEPMGRQM